MVKCKCGTYHRYGDEIAGRNVAQGMHLDACMNCGYIPKNPPPPKETPVIPEEPTRLGDRVTNVLDAVGVTTVVKKLEAITGVDCGCNRRRVALNNLDKRIRG